MSDISSLLIERAAEIKAVGVSFNELNDAQGRPLSVGTPVSVLPQPDNPYDACALAVTTRSEFPRHLGYVPKSLAARVHGDLSLRGRILHGVVTGIRLSPENGAVAGFDFTVKEIGELGHLNFSAAVAS